VWVVAYTCVFVFIWVFIRVDMVLIAVPETGCSPAGTQFRRSRSLLLYLEALAAFVWLGGSLQKVKCGCSLSKIYMGRTLSAFSSPTAQGRPEAIASK